MVCGAPPILHTFWNKWSMLNSWAISYRFGITTDCAAPNIAQNLMHAIVL
jgi:hypothetical protein